MATTMYFRAQAFNMSPNVPWRWGCGCEPIPGPSGNVQVHNQGGLSTGRGTTAANFNTATVNGPTTVLVQRIIGTVAQWVSAPLAQDVTIAGAITLNLRCSESSMSANAAMNAHVSRVASDGTVTAIGQSNRTIEMGTSETAENFTITPTSTAFSRGDRIRVLLFFQDSAAAVMASGFQVNFVYDGPTGGASGDSFVTFTETFSLAETDPTGTTIFPTNTASAVATADNDLEAWTSRGAGVQSATRTSVTGNTAPLQFAGAAGISWWTRPLAATTLSGVVLANIRGLESNVSANGTVRCEVAVTAGDGSGAAVWGATTMDAELSSAEGVLAFYVSGANTAISEGQRIRIRIFADDMEGGGMVSGFTLTLRYAGTTGGASGDTFLTFPITLTESVGGPAATDVMPYLGGGYYP